LIFSFITICCGLPLAIEIFSLITPTTKSDEQCGLRHAIGDIITKISVNCVLIYMLHYYLWEFPIYVACICLVLFLYESVHLHNVFFCFKLYI
jgi:hypothetical protein